MSEDNTWEKFWWDQKMGINQAEQADWINTMYPETDDSALELRVHEQPQTVMEFSTDKRFAYDELSINYENEPVITLNLRTGDSTFGPNYDPDAAAEIFWDCVKTMIPQKAKTFTWEEIVAAWEENYPEGGFTIPLDKLATTLGINPPRGTEVETLSDPHYDGNGWNLNEKDIENLRFGGWTEEQGELIQVPPTEIPHGTIYYDTNKDMTYFYDTSGGITNADWKEYYDTLDKIAESLAVPNELVEPDENKISEEAYKRAMKVIE